MVSAKVVEKLTLSIGFIFNHVYLSSSDSEDDNDDSTKATPKMKKLPKSEKEKEGNRLYMIQYRVGKKEDAEAMTAEKERLKVNMLNPDYHLNTSYVLVRDGMS